MVLEEYWDTSREDKRSFIEGLYLSGAIRNSTNSYINIELS